MRVLLQTTLPLGISNVFMRFAWRAYFRQMPGRTRYVAVGVSWLPAFCAWVFMVPGNRIGSLVYSVAQLKILQEGISLTLFLPFSMTYMGERLRLNYL